MNEKKVIVAYIPVLHAGYLKLFEQHEDVTVLYLLGEEFIGKYRPLVKDIRALKPVMMKKVIESIDRFERVEILSESNVKEISEHSTVIMPDEEIMRDVAYNYFKEVPIVFDPIFLRWDRKNSESHVDVESDEVISTDIFDNKMIEATQELAKNSSDWWRQVGAILMKDKEIILSAKNYHVPYDYQHYIDGDPRSDFQSGEKFDLSTSVHAESAIIAQAAKKGISTEGTEMYCYTFPCPTCAKLIAESGIKKLYFKDGYAVLDGENVLKAKGVEIVKVVDEEPYGV